MGARIWIRVGLLFSVAMAAAEVRAQSFGIELHNTMMPASGGMAGASLTRPQDLQSAINGNPATLTQFRGTQFSLGRGWAEPTYKITQLDSLPAVTVDPYSAKSGTPGAAVPAIGLTQDLSALDLPVTLGMGLMPSAGAGVDFRDVPQSNGTSAEYLALDIVVGAGVDVTDRLAFGGAIILGTSYIDGPFVDLTGMVPAYGLRGSVGVNYLVNDATSAGSTTKPRSTSRLTTACCSRGGAVSDIDFDHPENLGLGIANSSLLDERLLLAADVLYKVHSDADFLRAIYTDQWVFQLGAQYSVTPRLRFRMGYAYNENPMRNGVGVTIGGVSLANVPSLQYIQGQFAAISQHRVTGGVGMRDVLPGVDLDLFAGGMFEESDQFGSTIASVESYWVGLGMTWRFGRGAVECGAWQ